MNLVGSGRLVVALPSACSDSSVREIRCSAYTRPVGLPEVYSERERAQHPMHLEALPDVHDESLAAWRCGSV